MRRSIPHILFALLIVLLSACASAPKKPTPLPNAQVNKLKNMRLDNQQHITLNGTRRSD